MNRGHWSNTATGRQVYPGDPLACEVDLLDIAESLARICRFNGHLRRDVEHFSVAQHSVLVSYACSPQHALIGLLHDAHETYLADLTRPTAALTGADWHKAETRWKVAIATHFGLDWVALRFLPEDVKRADDAVLATERRDLIEHRDRPWPLREEPLAERIVPLRAFDARDLFLSRFAELADRPALPLSPRAYIS